MEARKPTGDLLSMPALYFERTDAEEQARHREKLERLAAKGGLLIDPIEDAAGGWHVEIITMDWDEPGLLDRIFEAILRCTHIPEGIAVRRARIFTGSQGQVVNMLGLKTRTGKAVTRKNVEGVMEQLRRIQPGERGVLESIEHIPFKRLIPLVNAYPTLDNGKSDRYTFLRLKVAQISNRFTSVLLHFLARSELWLNIQIAEFRQDTEGVYEFYVVDKYGRKLRDSHFIRLSIVRVIEEMNRMLMRFNVHYVRRDWENRIDRNEKTIFHSRPNPDDFLQDLENIRQIAELKGLGRRLTPVVEHGLLESRHLYFLKKVEAFVTENAARIKALSDVPPDDADVAVCREYFDLRRRALRIMIPLFERLVELEPLENELSDEKRLRALCHPVPSGPYAHGKHDELYHTGAIWLEEPAHALDPFFLMARTDCFFRTDFLDTLEAAIEGWTPQYVAHNAQALGDKFLAVVDESIRQGNTAALMRNLREAGMLRRYLPGFAEVEGLVHVVADHSYTVDEHTFIVIEALQGLSLLADVVPEPGRSMMRKEFEALEDNVQLQRFAQKHVMDLRMLRQVTEMRRNPAVKPFFMLMEEVQRNSLEYLVETNFLDQSYSTCMVALSEIEKIRQQLQPLVVLYNSLPFGERRTLMLAALLHDLKKPAREHGPIMAAALHGVLETMGLALPPEDVTRIAWLVEHHIDIRPLLNRMGAEGEGALLKFADAAGDPALVRSLVLFTYADRVAVALDPNKTTHDAMVLSSMLDALAKGAPAEPASGKGRRFTGGQDAGH